MGMVRLVRIAGAGCLGVAAGWMGCGGPAGEAETARGAYRFELYEPGARLGRFPTGEEPMIQSASTLAVRDGEVYVLDQMGSRVLRFTADGSFLNAVGRPGKGPGELESPSGMMLSEAGVWVSSPPRSRIVRYAPSGELLEEYRTPYPAANFTVMGERPLIPSLVDRQLLVQVRPDGDTVSLPGPPQVPAPLRAELTDRIAFLGFLLSPVAPGTIALLRNRHADDFDLWRLSVSDGSLSAVHPVPLPEWLHRLMAEEADRVRKEMPEDFATGDFMIPFHAIHAAGGLLWLAPTANERVLAVGVPMERSGRARAVTRPNLEEFHDVLDVVVEGTRLFALAPTEVRVYDLRSVPGTLP